MHLVFLFVRGTSLNSDKFVQGTSTNSYNPFCTALPTVCDGTYKGNNLYVDSPTHAHVCSLCVCWAALQQLMTLSHGSDFSAALICCPSRLV